MKVLQAAGAIALLCVGVFFGVLAHVAAQLPQKLDAIQADVNQHARLLREEASRQIEEARRDVLVRSERQISGLRADLGGRVDASLSTVDRRIGDSLVRVDGILTIATELHRDLQPVLSNAAALTKDAQDSWDDLYWDVKGSVASFTVASRGIAEASEAVGKAAPALSLAATSTTQQLAGITADVHTFTTRFTAPRTKKQALWDGIKTGALLGSRLIP